MKRYLLFLLLIPLAASSCLRDEYFRTRSGKGEREVEIKLFAPGMGGDTRAGEITDTGIVTVDILVFQGAGGGSDTDNAVYDYTRYAWHKSGNIYSTVLKTGSDLDIYFAINARGIISTVDLTGKTFGEARQMLRMTGSPNASSGSSIKSGTVIGTSGNSSESLMISSRSRAAASASSCSRCWRIVTSRHSFSTRLAA